MNSTSKVSLSTKLTLSKETVKSLRLHTAVRTGGAPLKCPTDTSLADISRTCKTRCNA